MPTPLRQRVYAAVKERHAGTPQAIAALLGIDREQARNILGKLGREGALVRKQTGEYAAIDGVDIVLYGRGKSPNSAVGRPEAGSTRRMEGPDLSRYNRIELERHWPI